MSTKTEAGNAAKSLDQQIVDAMERMSGPGDHDRFAVLHTIDLAMADLRHRFREAERIFTGPDREMVSRMKAQIFGASELVNER